MPHCWMGSWCRFMLATGLVVGSLLCLNGFCVVMWVVQRGHYGGIPTPVVCDRFAFHITSFHSSSFPTALSIRSRRSIWEFLTSLHVSFITWSSAPRQFQGQCGTLCGVVCTLNPRDSVMISRQATNVSSSSTKPRDSCWLQRLASCPISVSNSDGTSAVLNTPHFIAIFLSRSARTRSDHHSNDTVELVFGREKR